MSIGELSGVFKKIQGRKTDDWIDKLNHDYTLGVLVAFAIVITSTQLVGNPILCWNPPELSVAGKESYNTYIHSYCWVKNTYHIPFHDILPVDVPTRTTSEIIYYQWTPLILLTMAFLFKFPHFVWKSLNSSTGLNIYRLCAIADECVCASPDDRKENVDNAAVFLEKWLSSFEHRRKTAGKFERYFTWLHGSFLSYVYIAIKIMYVTNVVGQIFLLGEFLGVNYSFGISILVEMVSGDGSSRPFKESVRFPRVTMCDFQIRQLQNIQRHTVQCVLPINLFNEKIFVFLWFWYLIVAIFTFSNLLKWFYLLVFKKNNYVFVKKYLTLRGDLKQHGTKIKCKEFAETYIRDDGCFVLRMLAYNSSDIVVTDILHELWIQWRSHEGNENSDSHVTGQMSDTSMTDLKT